MIIVRVIFKIILFPISIALSIIAMFLTFILGLSTVFFKLISFIAIMGFLGSVINGEKNLAVEAIILAFLFSPYGIPALGYVVVELIKEVNEKIKLI